MVDMPITMFPNLFSLLFSLRSIQIQQMLLEISSLFIEKKVPGEKIPVKLLVVFAVGIS